MLSSLKQDFPGGSDDKESACSAGDPGLIPGSGRVPWEGNSYPHQCSCLENSMDKGAWRVTVHRVPKSQTWLSNSTFIWASFVAQLVKNPPAVWETWVWSLGGEDPLAKGRATHSSILGCRIPWTAQSMGSQRVGHDWETFTLTVYISAVEKVRAPDKT